MLRLDFCSARACAYAVKRWHYSRSLPPPPRVQVGVWEDGHFIGVVLFSRGASGNLLKPYGLTNVEGCELTRIALARHKSPVSRIGAIALKLLQKQSPGMRLIVSFADPLHKHHGGIYQAMGWTYLGKTSPTPLFKGPDGKLWHSRMVSKTGVNLVYGKQRRVYRIDQCERIITPGKHRYALALDPKLRALLKQRARPYPVREDSAAAAAL